MLTISIDHSETADYIYQQIYQHIKAVVLKRSLMPHTKVPSKRELAETLKVSVNSVNSAYQQLLSEGYLYAVERKGFSWRKLIRFIMKKRLRFYCLMI